MQLGELQENEAAFAKRGAKMVAISVDPVTTSTKWAKKRGFTFEIAADPEMKIIDGFKIRNPQDKKLSLHAIFIVDEEGKVFYRKVARRRAKSKELLDALDHHKRLLTR